ncbi:hypothetical protein [Arthrobacter sp. UYEF36]|uniref:hypothetical protein n=1 Tax=Arthrobacter sp. UYEF36 TaxID=1756366 RepID=UPI0033931C32
MAGGEKHARIPGGRESHQVVVGPDSDGRLCGHVVEAALAGLTVVIAGNITQTPIVGGAGFLLMIGGTHWTLTCIQGHP